MSWTRYNYGRKIDKLMNQVKERKEYFEKIGEPEYFYYDYIVHKLYKQIDTYCGKIIDNCV